MAPMDMIAKKQNSETGDRKSELGTRKTVQPRMKPDEHGFQSDLSAKIGAVDVMRFHQISAFYHQSSFLLSQFLLSDFWNGRLLV
jgi:hypothetical protein